MDTDRGGSLAAGAGFAALVIGVAAALVPLRNELGGANVALVLVLLVVGAAATGGRVGGAIAAVAASVAFNFFHTEPYLTVRVNDAKDIMTIGLVLAVGLAVGELGVARSRQSTARRSHLRSMRALEEIGAAVSAGSSAADVWPTVQAALVSTLGLRAARFDAAERHSLPAVERDGRLDVRDRRFAGGGFELPDSGAVLPVEAEGVFLGEIVLLPGPAVGVTREQRRAAVAIADQFAIAVSTHGPLASFD